MSDLLLVVVFTVHLVAVNIAAAGPLLCVAVEWRGTRRGRPDMVAASRRLAGWSLAGFLAGIVIGTALLAILWRGDGSYWAALHRVPAHRWGFFGGELVFYLACMIAYVVLWNRARSQRSWHRLLAVLASTNVLYHFPPLFTMLSLMSTRPELADLTLDRSLYVELFTDPETLARVAHHWLASITTAAVALLLLTSQSGPQAEQEDHTASSGWPATVAARVALLATALQLPTGLWLLLASPARAQSQLLGGEVSTTVIFSLAIVAMVLLLQSLAAAALGDSARSTAIKAAASLLTVLLLMSYVLHRTRAQLDADPEQTATMTFAERNKANRSVS
jgi:hypothetical protein